MPAVISRCAECVALVILSGLLLAGCPLPVGDSLLTEEEQFVEHEILQRKRPPESGNELAQMGGTGYSTIVILKNR